MGGAAGHETSSVRVKKRAEEVGQDHVRLRKSPINALGMQGMYIAVGRQPQ